MNAFTNIEQAYQHLNSVMAETRVKIADLSAAAGDYTAADLEEATDRFMDSLHFIE